MKQLHQSHLLNLLTDSRKGDSKRPLKNTNHHEQTDAMPEWNGLVFKWEEVEVGFPNIARGPAEPERNRERHVGYE